MPDGLHSAPDSALRLRSGQAIRPSTPLRTFNPQSAIRNPQLACLMEDIISSYEQRIDGVQSIFDTTRLALTDFQEGADQAREEQELIHRQLRDALARNENLRNKDYDLMLQRIIEPRREQEKETRALLNDFLADQQRLAAALKERYGQIRAQLPKGNTPQILDLLKSIKELLAEQDRCKQELTANLREAQADQQATVKLVKQLLVKGNTLRIKDFKDMLAHIQNQGHERITRKFKRREEVRRMLATFKQQRLEDAPSREHCDVRIKEALEAATYSAVVPTTLSGGTKAGPWSPQPQGGERTCPQGYPSADGLQAQNNMVQKRAG